jgi:hypothetical protein
MNNNYYTIEPTQAIQGISYGLWQPEAVINTKIKVDTGITSNCKYRQYMQKNANDIMKYNTMQSINASGNNPYTLLNTNTVNNIPYLYNSLHDTNNPLYGYRDTDLKRDYMEKQQIKARMISPSIPTKF